MIPKNFLTLRRLFLLFIGVVFLRIYQHNQLIKLSYQGQRLDRVYATLEKERNELLVKRYEQQSPARVMQLARAQGMVPLKLTQLCVLPEAPLLEFFGTGTDQATLTAFGYKPPVPKQAVRMSTAIPLKMHHSGAVQREAVQASRLSFDELLLKHEAVGLAENKLDFIADESAGIEHLLQVALRSVVEEQEQIVTVQQEGAMHVST